ncbi:MAG TPA: glycosyltransferase family 4 protein [Gammaproteobacteria bacterium]|nr:glycosyltransferase family 4 protein [Gammaproteobacteria bacterium]
MIHLTLSRRLENYTLHTFSPSLEYFPPLMLRYRKCATNIVHVPADYGGLVTPRRAKLVATFHNYYLDPWFVRHCSFMHRIHYSTDLRWFTRQALKRASLVTAVSRYTAELVREDLDYAGELRIVPNGIDIERFSAQPEPHAGIRVLFSGNMSHRKGAHLLERIAKGLSQDVELWIASGLRDDVFSSGLPKNVRIIGRVPYDDMPALYNRVDILLMPTLREGFGLAVAEAMACGLPVVATNCSAIPEILQDELGGYLIDAERVDDFIDRINYLAGDSSMRSRMGSINRQRIVSQFGETHMIEGYRRAFAELCG